MKPIENPSEFFMTKRERNLEVSGCALMVAREGTPISRSRKFSSDFLHSILEQHCKIDFFSKNIVAKVTGGSKLRE